MSSLPPRLACALVLLPMLLLGCGKPSRESARMAETSAGLETAQLDKHEAGETSNGKIPAAPADRQRKIIYVADVSFVVDDFGATQRQVSQLVQKFGGFIAQMQIDRATGERRLGTWVVRIPVDNFESFLSALDRLGIPESRQQNAQDVTEEYVDLEARISNAKRIEARLLKLLEERTGDIKDVIAVEEKLGRVRGEIEQMEGRLRFLSNRTELTTVTIHAREDQSYQPPAARTRTARIGSGWHGSLAALQDVAASPIVALVIALPWLLVGLVSTIPMVWLIRRYFGRRRLAAARGQD